MRITINKDYISTAILCSSITAGIEHGKIRHGGTFILSILKCFFLHSCSVISFLMTGYSANVN